MNGFELFAFLLRYAVTTPLKSFRRCSGIAPMTSICRCWMLLPLIFFSGIAKSNVTLPVIFQDNMVLQRDKPCAIWGWASPQEKLTIQLENDIYSVKADKNGNWKIMLTAKPAGGPVTIRITGKNQLTLKNVLFGDVWICGGQSNMQFRVRDMEMQKPADLKTKPDIRIFTAVIASDYVAKKDLAGGKWEIASDETVDSFSAVAYFFGQYLHEKIQVPIGLISDNLGATSVETWMSPSSLTSFPQFNTYHKLFLAPNKSFAKLNADFEKIRSSWQRAYLKDDPGLKEEWFKPDTDTSDWKNIELPSYWEDKGLPDYDGSVWFRRTFDLPADYKAGTFSIPLGQIDDYDITWVNGFKVGETLGNLNIRNYNVPDSILKPKNNILVVRAFDTGGRGGLYNMYWFGNWSGTWKYKPGKKLGASNLIKPNVPNAALFSSPSILYDGCIAPLINLSIKGALWYQGEANASRAEEYEKLFAAFIGDWRKQFSQGDFPFYFVQLANYMQEARQPSGSTWAELRESQAAALSLPNTGMAVTIDIGEANDIHPKNKYDVGKRLAKAALQETYQMETEHSSPLYDTLKINGDHVTISFKNLSGPLHSNDKYGYVKGFAIAGEDSIFHWARASVENNQVSVYSPEVIKPVAVRYAWSDNPGELNFYNQDDLPVAPFRTDHWPRVTLGKVFSENP